MAEVIQSGYQAKCGEHFSCTHGLEPDAQLCALAHAVHCPDNFNATTAGGVTVVNSHRSAIDRLREHFDL